MPIWFETSKTIRYIIVGVFNTALGYSVFGAMLLLFDKALPYIIILILSHLFGVSLSFLTQRHFVFGGKIGLFWVEYLRFQVSYLWLASQGILLNWSLVHFLDWSPWLSQGVSMLSGIMTAFFLHRSLVFRVN